MAKTQSNNKSLVGTGLEEPRQYNVIFHNDDITPMDFVVNVIRTIFRKTDKDAENLMWKVHKEGQAVVGTYTLDIAASKANKVMRLARGENFPLNVTVELVFNRFVIKVEKYNFTYMSEDAVRAEPDLDDSKRNYGRSN